MPSAARGLLLFGVGSEPLHLVGPYERLWVGRRDQTHGALHLSHGLVLPIVKPGLHPVEHNRATGAWLDDN